MISIFMRKVLRCIRSVFSKLKEIISNKNVQIVLLSGAIAVAAFLAGKLLERNRLYRLITIPVRPALPLFGSVPARPIPESGIINTSFSNALDKIQSFTRKLFPKDFGTIKAATPVPAPLIEDEDKLMNSNAARVSQIMRHGFPGLDNIITFNDYVISYDKRNRVPHWVFEHLTEESVKSNDRVDRSKCVFQEDDQIHPFFRSHNTDYKGSGYDRGHLAAAGNHKTSQQHVEETFYLSNIAPQVGKGFNRDSWNRLEKYVRKLTKTYPNVYCCTGPLYLPLRESSGRMYVKYEVIGANHVAVPTHFYKVVVGETKDGTLEMECYVMENAVINDNISLKSFQVPPELIERAAGLLFFNNVARKTIRKINGKKP